MEQPDFLFSRIPFVGEKPCISITLRWGSCCPSQSQGVWGTEDKARRESAVKGLRLLF